jgi:hypothetical protein
LITLWITNLQSKVSVPVCSGDVFTPEYAYNEQNVYNLIALVVAKKELGDLTEEQNQKIKSSFKLSETMCCYCQGLTNKGYYLWKLREQNWTQYDSNDKRNYCLDWYKLNLLAWFLTNLSDYSVIIINSAVAIIFDKVS